MPLTTNNKINENFIRRKPIILIFYQGAWSKDANRQMDQWVKLTPQLEALGYQVAAITPDQPSQLKTSMVQHLYHLIVVMLVFNLILDVHFYFYFYFYINIVLITVDFLFFFNLTSNDIN